MKPAVKKELLTIFSQAIQLLEAKDETSLEKLKQLSDQAVEAVALHKDLDLISVTVLLYSFYKIAPSLPPEDYQDLLTELKLAKDHLQQTRFRRYNQSIKTLFNLTRKSNAKIKTHLQDVLHAARIKKGEVLLSKGLSLGQAAGLMGLSNWDLQEYAGHTTSLEQHHEALPAKERLLTAFKLFSLK